jgi:hypothetical protein
VIFLKDHTFIRNDSIFIKLDAIKKIADHLFRYLPEIDKGKNKGKELADTTISRLLRNGFRSNPFFSIGPFIPVTLVKDKSITEKYFTNGIKSVTSSVGGLDITSLADGMAKFLVERVKEELSIAFFDQFKNDLKKYPDLQTLFPYTYDVLMAIDSEIYNFTAYIDILREAFLKDFQLIIPDIRKLVEKPMYRDYFNNNPQLYSIIQVAFQVVDDYQLGVYPGDIIMHLADMDASILNPIDPNMKPSLQVLNLFIQSVRSKTSDQYIVPFDSIRKNLLNDSIAFKIYLGLIYQKSKIKGITFICDNSPVDFCNVLDSAYIQAEKRVIMLKRYKHIIEEIISLDENVQQALLIISEKDKPPDNKLGYKDYFCFYNASLNFIEYVGDIPVSIGMDTPYKFNWGKNKSTFFFVVDKLGEIYLDINEIKYGPAILNAAFVYDTIFSEHVGNKKNKAFNTGTLIIKYGNFAAAVSKAETSDQVKQVIESVALPAGSSRIKRECAFNIALNAYVSGYWGKEKFTFTENNIKMHQIRNTAGLTAPIGIAFSKSSDYPFGKKWRSSYSIFASVIDLGAFTSFRFRDTINNAQPKVTIENIFSPGLYIIYGIPRTPISIGGGWQYGPSLRKIESSAATIEPKQYTKWCLFIGVDIPILNFYTKPKK